MLLIRVYRVLDHPACSVTFERDQAFANAFPGVRTPDSAPLAYWSEETWPHPGDTRDLGVFVFRTLQRGEQKIGEWGGWHCLV